LAHGRLGEWTIRFTPRKKVRPVSLRGIPFMAFLFSWHALSLPCSAQSPFRCPVQPSYKPPMEYNSPNRSIVPPLRDDGRSNISSLYPACNPPPEKLRNASQKVRLQDILVSMWPLGERRCEVFNRAKFPRNEIKRHSRAPLDLGAPAFWVVYRAYTSWRIPLTDLGPLPWTREFFFSILLVLHNL
jgi:hypothetical protein